MYLGKYRRYRVPSINPSVSKQAHNTQQDSQLGFDANAYTCKSFRRIIDNWKNLFLYKDLITVSAIRPYTTQCVFVSSCLSWMKTLTMRFVFSHKVHLFLFSMQCDLYELKDNSFTKVAYLFSCCVSKID